MIYTDINVPHRKVDAVIALLCAAMKFAEEHATVEKCATVLFVPF